MIRRLKGLRTRTKAVLCAATIAVVLLAGAAPIAVLAAPAAVATASVVAQGAIPPEAAQFLDLLDALLRLSMLAFAVLPVAEVRKVFGGLPPIPLPGGHSISAGRWFSWLAAAGILAFGYAAGWLKLVGDPATYQAQVVLAYAILAALSNAFYEKFWRGQLGLEITNGETTVTVETTPEPARTGGAWPTK